APRRDAVPRSPRTPPCTPGRPARRPVGVATMSALSSDPDPLLPLADEFAQRYRRGERPSLTEYAEKHPELAERIRRLFPTLVVMEEFGSVAGEPTGPVGAPAGAVPPWLGEDGILPYV